MAHHDHHTTHTEKIPQWAIVHPLLVNVIPPSVASTERFYTIEIVGEAFWVWKDLKSEPRNYFEALNSSLKLLGYKISNNEEKRIGIRLGVETRYLHSKVSKEKNVKKRKSIRASFVRRISIDESQVTELAPQYLQETKMLKQQILELEKKLDEKAEEVFDLLNEAMEQKRKIHKLEEATDGLKNRGKPIHEVGDRQKYRQFNNFREKTAAVLWFAETYGLVPVSLQIQEKETKEVHELLLSPGQKGVAKDPPQATPSTSNAVQNEDNHGSSKYSKLDDEEKEKVKKIVYILDRFGVSNEAYHEFTQLEGHESMMRSYIVEECQADINKQIRGKISKTPGPCQGAEMSFPELLRKEISKELQNKEASVPNVLKVKISGDGAAISHSSNLVVCTFSLLTEDANVMSSSGNHAIAIVKAPEKYETLKSALANVIKDVNQLNDAGWIEVDGKRLNLEFFLGGDYKFLLMCLGMLQANCKNSCIYCKISTTERQNMDRTEDYCESPEMRRLLHSQWKKDPGCREQPLFTIPIDHVIVDELHLLLRITDRLEAGLIYQVLDWDEKDNFRKPKCQQKDQHLQDFMDAVRSCGVSLKVWKKDNKWDWTSLLGGEKKRLLQKLPAKFEQFLPQLSVNKVTMLWNKFEELYVILSSENPSQQEIDTFHTKAKSWARDLLSMKGPGYDAANPITPYIHVMVYHCPTLLRRYGNIKMFTGQGVEKKNDDVRRNFHRKINRWDPCASLLTVEKRQEDLLQSQREKRSYTKANMQHWDEGGKSDATKKFPRIST